MTLFFPGTTLVQQAWRKMCLHLDGAAIGSTVCALFDAGILDRLEEATGPVAIDDLAAACGAKRGYFHLAIKLLAAQGLIERSGDPGGALAAELTLLGRLWVRQAPVYRQVPRLLAGAMALLAALHDRDHGEEVAALPVFAEEQPANPLAEWVRMHLWGAPVAAALTGLSLRGDLATLSAAADAVAVAAIAASRAGAAALSILAAQGWIERSSGGPRLTPEGTLIASWVAQYYQAATYLPTFRKVPELIFGAATGEDRATDLDGGIDAHLDRALDVSYSGKVFSQTCRDAFFDIALPIFDQSPLRAQPRCVVDTGSGDGTMLKELFFAIRERTARGQALDTHPLTMIGVEMSPIAREVTGRALREAGVPNAVIAGDIGDPEAIARALAEAGFTPDDTLHVSKSVIHDRAYRPSPEVVSRLQDRPVSTAVFVAEDGGLIENDALVDDLIGHFGRWRRWVERHGMIVIEAHTVDPRLAAQHVGHSLIAGLDATHGYSRQYLVEMEIFRWAAQQAGLVSRRSHELVANLVGRPLLSIDHFVTGRTPFDRVPTGRTASRSEPTRPASASVERATMLNLELAEDFWATQNQGGALTLLLARFSGAVVIGEPQFLQMVENAHLPRQEFELVASDGPLDPASWRGKDVFLFAREDYPAMAEQLARQAADAGGRFHDWPYEVFLAAICADDSWRRSAEPLTRPALSYNIACTGRSGSTFLCDLLARNGYGMPVEHIGVPMISLFRSRSHYRLGSRRLLEALVCRSARNGVFGTKVISFFYWPIARAMGPDDVAAFDEFIWSKPTIYLSRRSKIRQAVSDFIARSTRVWHVGADPASYDEQRARIDALDYDFDKINVRYGALVSEEAALGALVEKLPIVQRIDYEDLAARTAEVLAAIVQFITGREAPRLVSRSHLRRVASSKHEEFALRFGCDLRQRGLSAEAQRDDPAVRQPACI